MDKLVQWSILDKSGILVYDGDFMFENGQLYITDGHGDYVDLYSAIELSLAEFNNYLLNLSFYHDDKEYCLEQVQQLKNLFKNVFPEYVLINGDGTEMQYNESLITVKGRFYKKFNI